MYRTEPLFLQPVFQERIWGGKKLREQFHYEIPSSHTGEAWVISAHPHGPSIIKNGPLAGRTLTAAWKHHGHLFNRNKDSDEPYPLLVKILDAADDLSVQVHPNDLFAQKVEGAPYGKTECWYVLSAEEGAKLVLGHHAVSNQQLADRMDNGEWEKLLRHVNVKAGDFIYVPSGTIHAIGKGIVLLETQQSSDITYRVYDYDRQDASGRSRELHLERAKEVTLVPHEDARVIPTEAVHGGLMERKLVEAQYFTVYSWKLTGAVTRRLAADFLQVSVIAGKAELSIANNCFTVQKGCHFIIPSDIAEYTLTGKAELIVSHL
ncbi:mannose-6-phosphate isomerase [Evansella caseinilytica]|uniref:Mannose-6-phosphate isomerase n=1 Tax=Evansella caseinilytica TaxID=1503961 RepID=A0A1H3UF18_9BACI|nr:mannose-6-phosphate isomerase, class I [Evansella caseinilytica]SDZ60641.1 mannose-6-phosphate isomerase [Evansella caseinilytica]